MIETRNDHNGCEQAISLWFMKMQTGNINSTIPLIC